MEDEELGPENEEVPANEVNYACRYINLTNILGARDWGRKNCAEECSSMVDTGFNGGGLCTFSCLRKYVEYLQSFYPKQNCLKRMTGN